MKLLLTVIALAAVFASADASVLCATQVQPCLEALTANLDAISATNLVQNWCQVLPPYIQCVSNACPELADALSNLLTLYEEELAVCGTNFAGGNNIATGYCAVFNDPWVRDMNGAMRNCTLGNNTEVYKDAANTVTMDAWANPNWVNKGLTAVRKVTVTNSRTGWSGSFDVTGSSTQDWTDTGGTSSDSSLVVKRGVVWDKTTGFILRTKSRGSGATKWVNSYLRAARSGTGICRDASMCAGASPTPRKVVDARSLIGVVPRDASCDAITDAEYQATCNSDASNTGGTDFSEAAAFAAADRAANGSWAAAMIPSAVLAASCVLLAMIF